MYNLIPLSVLLIYASCYGSGHHRGEQDIELSSPIMKFLKNLKVEDNYYLKDVSSIDDGIMEMKPFILHVVHVELDISEKDETTHCNIPANSLKNNFR